MKSACACANCGTACSGDYCCGGCEAAASLLSASAVSGAARQVSTSGPAPPARRAIALAVPSISCGACAAAIERALAPLVGPPLDAPRIDIAKRLVHLLAADTALPAVLERLAAAGHPATVVANVASVDRGAARGEWLRLGVA